MELFTLNSEGFGLEAVRTVGLGKKYGDKWGLRDATFSLPRGKICMLLGPNGAGKTTTVKLLATILKPSSGYAEVLGHDIESEYRVIRRLITYMPQEASIDNNWTPYEAVKWYLVARGYPYSNASSIARDWLTRLGLDKYRDMCGWRLSGGNKRKILLAMAIAPESELVFLDEPTSGLDVETKYVVWGVLRDVARDGRTILLTTHDMKEGERLSDYLVFLSNGEVIYHGWLGDLLGKFPYKYRLLMEDRQPVNGLPSIEVGGNRIVYLRDLDEAGEFLGRRDTWESVKLEKTSLEDIYLNMVRGVEYA